MPEFYSNNFEEPLDDNNSDQEGVDSSNKENGGDSHVETRESEKQASNIEKHRLRFTKRYETFMAGLRNRKNGQEITPEDIAVINKRLKGLDNLDAYIEKHYSNEFDQTLRETQMNVFEDLRYFLEQGETEGYVKLPTGVGKTVIFTEFLEAFNQRTLIAVPTKLLVGQTQEKIEQFAPDVEVGRIYQYAKEFGKQATITTYQSLVSQIKEGKINPDDYDCLILDEVHESLTDKRVEAVQRFGKAIKIGFTATPQYSDRKGVADVLLGAEIHEMSIKEAALEGLVSPFSVLIAQTEADLSNVAVTGSGDYDQNKLEEAINIESRNRGAVRIYQEIFNGKKAVLNAINVGHAQKMAEMFEEAGIPATMIYEGTSERDRNEILQKYASGEIMVLCNVGVLTRGFDEPSAEVCLNLRPTLSRVLAEQRAGRVLRLDPSNPDKFAYVVDFLDKNENKKNLPLTFADIAGEAVIFGPDDTGLSWKFGKRAMSGEGKYKAVETMSAADKIKIEGLQITVKADEVMRIISEREKQKYEIAPEGWLTLRELKKELGAGGLTIQKILTEYVYDGSKWCKTFLNRTNGRPFKYFHPELVSIIKNRYLEKQEIGHVPPEWTTADDLSKELHMGYAQMVKLLDGYKKTDILSFREYLNENERIATYIHPDLAETIRAKYSQRTQIDYAPTGWKTMNDIRNEFGVGQKFIKGIADINRQNHPEWFKTYLGGNESRTAPYEFLHPDLATIITEEISKRRKLGHAPEGWITAKKFASLSNMPHVSSIEYLISKHKKTDDPANFKTFLNDRNQPAEYISPRLAAVMAQEIEHSLEQKKNITPAPPGWFTKNDLRAKKGIRPEKIKETIDNYRQTHPEWFGTYLEPKRKLPAEYLSPELIEILEQLPRRKYKKRQTGKN